MSFFLELGRMVFQYIPLGFLASMAVDPVTAGFMWLVAALVWFQARRQAQTEERLWGVVRNPPLSRTLTSMVYGVVGGILGSLILSYVGVPFAATSGDFLYLWVVALGLSLLHPRFICFSYGAGLLGAATLLFGWPGIGVPQVATLVAVLHLVEAAMIRLDGGSSASPVFARRPGGEVVGGFSLQRFWPVPLTLLLAASAQSVTGAQTIATPDWWPLIRVPDPKAVLALVPVVAAVGYSDVALAEDVPTKVRRSSGRLALYALTLLGLGLLADRSPVGAWAAVLFAPLGHEWVVWSEARREQFGPAHWHPADRGLRVLDVLPGTPAAAVGLASGHILLAVDGQPVDRRDQLREALRTSPSYCMLEFQTSSSHHLLRRLPAGVHDEGEMGLVLVPEPDDPPMWQMNAQGFLSRWLTQAMARLRGHPFEG